MKKISKLLALAAAVSTLFFASCSDVDTSGAVAEGTNDKTSNAKDYDVSFYTADDTKLDLSGYIAANTTAADRSIIADALDLDTSTNSNLFFYLWGTDALTAANSMTTPVEVDFEIDSTDTSKGKVTLDLASSKWNLVLAAATTSGLTSISDVKSKAYYIGYANVDLREADAIKFYLSTDGLTGTGKANITLVYDGLTTASPAGTWTSDHVTAVTSTAAADGYVIKASVQLRTNGSLVDGTSELTVTNADFFGSGSTLTTISAAPGTYNFVVSFTSNATGKSYEWSDIIIFVPNQTITQTVKVPDVVMYAPDAPENFQVGYVTPSSTDKESYTAVLQWEDKSNNEKYFNVEIWKIPASKTLTAAVGDDATWTTATSSLDEDVYKITLDDEFYGDIKNKGWVAGSMLKNNEHAALTLALGSRYVMRIASVNDAGTSTYAYATYDLDADWSDTDTYHTATYAVEPYVLKEIAASPASADAAYAPNATAVYAITASLFRLSYYLSGGTYTFDSGVTATGSLVYYLSQDAAGTGVPVFDPYNDPAATTAVYPFLVKNGNRWTSWRNGILEGPMYTTSTSTDHSGFTTFDPEPYTGFENLSLFASYTVASAEVEVYQHENYNFVDTELVITGTGSTKTSDNYYVIDNNGAGTMQVAYTLKTGRTTFTYDSITATITKLSDKSVVASGPFTSAGTYSFPTTQLPVGKYKLLVIGEYKGNQYSYNITLDVVES